MRIKESEPPAPGLEAGTRQRLLQAVDALIERLGYRKMSVENVVPEAGVSRATTHLYFPNKQSLVLAWAAERSQERLRQLRQLSQAPGLKPHERLRNVLTARVLSRYDGVQRCLQSLDDLIAEALRGRAAPARDRPGG
jgi:AcrR family transcriptional regulator